jgi:myo-inositol-1(or 4)-monophosphatase
VLAAARPDDAFVGEESGAHGAANAARRWYVDPLCGTLNFAAGAPPFCVNVALARTDGLRDQAVIAAVADPLSGEVFWCDASGAYRGGPDDAVRLTPSAESRLVDVQVDGSGDIVGPRLVADATFRAAFAVRVSSSTLGLTWVAAGHRAAYVTDGSVDQSVHYAPGIALCEAAGCVVTDLDGGPVVGGRGLVAAADAATAERIRALVGRNLA